MTLKIGITQREYKHIYDSGQQEVRWALDHSWNKFIHNVLTTTERKVICCPLPNSEQCVLNVIQGFGIHGLILSGGNDIGAAPARDITEKILLDYAVQYKLPVFGVCRGAQMLQQYSGGALKQVNKGHVARTHIVQTQQSEFTVNSYHKYGIETLASSLRPLAHAQDGTIEAFTHELYPWLGVLWHPEREGNDFSCATWTENALQKLFGVGL